jgi:hypothetical protein
MEKKAQVQREKPGRVEQTQSRNRTTFAQAYVKIALASCIFWILILYQNLELNSLISAWARTKLKANSMEPKAQVAQQKSKNDEEPWVEDSGQEWEEEQHVEQPEDQPYRQCEGNRPELFPEAIEQSPTKSDLLADSGKDRENNLPGAFSKSRA